LGNGGGVGKQKLLGGGGKNPTQWISPWGGGEEDIGQLEMVKSEGTVHWGGGNFSGKTTNGSVQKGGQNPFEGGRGEKGEGVVRSRVGGKVGSARKGGELPRGKSLKEGERNC